MGIFDKLLGRKGGDAEGSESPEILAAKKLVKEVTRASKGSWWEIDLKKIAMGSELLEDSRAAQRDMVLALTAIPEKPDGPGADWKRWRTTTGCIKALLRRKLPFTQSGLITLLEWMRESMREQIHELPLGACAKIAETIAAEGEISEALSRVASEFTKEGMKRAYDPGERKHVKRIGEALGGAPEVHLEPRDVWAAQAIEDLEAMPSPGRKQWNLFLSQAQTANAGKPTKKWIKEMSAIIEPIDGEAYVSHLSRWFELANKPAPQSENEREAHFDPLSMASINEDILKGIAWTCSIRQDPALTRALTPLCVSAFRKLPGVGPRAVRVGNACIYSLGAIEGGDSLAQLALLKVKIKNRSLQNQIAKALGAAAEREGVTPGELEEMSVPEYGLTGVGVLEETFGDFTARLKIEGSNSTSLVWVKPDGKEQKSVPAAVKESHSDELKELRATAKDIQKMLPAIRERIDNLFLAQKTWAFSVWKERYIDHPLTGSIAQRLIWTIGEGSSSTNVIFFDGEFVDAKGAHLSGPDADTPVRLWHPLDGDLADALAWRHWLEEHLVQQPFKQAHREIYLLTDAERNTGTYSNRYAAHIIKQHQFNALCAARDWQNTLRLMVDDSYLPPSRYLLEWGVRAEFWVEGIGDQYDVDTTGAGTYLRLATDQVRFYAIDAEHNTAHASGGGYGQGGWGRNRNPAEPQPLEEVPALVFSEIMRDVDLFVGVASVGNDPTWSDGGPGGHYHDYWHSVSFGDLTATAKTRKEILDRLLPKLKIAKQTHIDGKFLIVEGQVRTYKIHLGSGNILMKPNDQYLCIVPNASARKSANNLFLPFEGDNMMAVVLSKAFLLAADSKITDTTILSQIGHQSG